jgi:hypothetical protein
LHQGRIIDGQCQCCEKIDVNRSTNPDGGVYESLVASIYYLAQDEKEVAAATKALAKAAGLADEEVVIVGANRNRPSNGKVPERLRFS